MTKAVSDGNGIPIRMDGVEIMASEGLVLSHSFPDNDFVSFFLVGNHRTWRQIYQSDGPFFGGIKQVLKEINVGT